VFRLIAFVQPREVGKSAARGRSSINGRAAEGEGPVCPSPFARQLGISSTYFQNSDATTDDNIVTDILHYASRFTGDEGQQDGRLVQVPEQEELAARCGGASHMAEQIGGWVPEDALEAQHHLKYRRIRDKNYVRGTSILGMEEG